MSRKLGSLIITKFFEKYPYLYANDVLIEKNLEINA